MTPRFNMPFELGLVVSWSNTPRQTNHTWLFLKHEGTVSRNL
jgi:hypothetical protein